jgi:DNA-directed RNA polymerase subunit RPC12/RpoP
MTKSYVATKIDIHQFEYNCSECGKPHYHGSNGNTTDRVEHRSSHCGKDTVTIHITEDTNRH